MVQFLEECVQKRYESGDEIKKLSCDDCMEWKASFNNSLEQLRWLDGLKKDVQRGVVESLIHLLSVGGSRVKWGKNKWGESFISKMRGCDKFLYVENGRTPRCKTCLKQIYFRNVGDDESLRCSMEHIHFLMVANLLEDEEIMEVMETILQLMVDNFRGMYSG